jgi:hypothetical protein
MVNFSTIALMVLPITIITQISITILITIVTNNIIKIKFNRTYKCRQTQCILTQTRKNKNCMINKSISLTI